jgi:hypothetical protein
MTFAYPRLLDALQWLGLRVLALGPVERRQIVEAGGHLGVLRA